MRSTNDLGRSLGDLSISHHRDSANGAIVVFLEPLKNAILVEHMRAILGDNDSVTSSISTQTYWTHVAIGAVSVGGVL